jgi:hypothetical protein
VASYDPWVVVPPEHREFARQTEVSRSVDAMPTFRALSRETGVSVDALVHHALVRWASAGAEALMALEPQVLRELIAARQREAGQHWPESSTGSKPVFDSTATATPCPDERAAR